MIKMKRKDFNKLVEEIVDSMVEWGSSENLSKIENEIPLNREPVAIDPKPDLQVFDEGMPIEDSNWIPGNKVELGRAMKQMAGLVPDGQIEWFYIKLKRLIDGSLDKEDEGRMRPRLG